MEEKLTQFMAEIKEVGTIILKCAADLKVCLDRYTEEKEVQRMAKSKWMAKGYEIKLSKKMIKKGKKLCKRLRKKSPLIEVAKVELYLSKLLSPSPAFRTDADYDGDFHYPSHKEVIPIVKDNLKKLLKAAKFRHNNPFSGRVLPTINAPYPIGHADGTFPIKVGEDAYFVEMIILLTNMLAIRREYLNRERTT